MEIREAVGLSSSTLDCQPLVTGSVPPILEASFILRLIELKRGLDFILQGLNKRGGHGPVLHRTSFLFIFMTS